MFSKSRRKKSADYVDTSSGERDDEERHRQAKDNHTIFNRSGKIDLIFNEFLFAGIVLVPIGHDKSTAYISHLLQEADLSALAQLDTIHQIKFFIEERVHMINQVRFKIFRPFFFNFISFD